MTKGKELEKTQEASAKLILNEQQTRTLQAAIAKSPVGRAPNDEEWNLFVFQAGTLGLNPFKNEIGMAKWSNAKGAPLVPYITWLGHLKLADDQHKLIGVERYWCGPDGEWKEVWLGDGYPAAAKVVLWLEGLSRPVVGVAKWSSWVKEGHPDKLGPDGKPIWKKYNGADYKEKDKSRLEPIGNWKIMPDHMLSVAAARLAGKVAARLTGKEFDFDAAAETILFRDRQKRAFALARELGLNDEQRHALSEGESWSTVDYETMCEIVARMEEMKRGVMDAGVEPREAPEAAGPGEALGGKSAADGDEEVVDGEIEEEGNPELGGGDPDPDGGVGGPTSLSDSLAVAAAGWEGLDERAIDDLEDGEGSAARDTGAAMVDEHPAVVDPVGAVPPPGAEVGTHVYGPDEAHEAHPLDLRQEAVKATEHRAQLAEKKDRDSRDILKNINIRRIKTKYPEQYERLQETQPLEDLTLEELAQLEEELAEGALADGSVQEKMV